MIKNVLSKSAFTLVEMLTVSALIAISTWAIVLWISSFWSSNEILNAENVFLSKIRNEKISVISWEVECSEVSISYWDGFFSIFHWENWKNACNKTIFWKIDKNDNNIILDMKNVEKDYIEVFTNWSYLRNIDFSLNDEKLTFWLLEDENLYKIIAESNNWKREELEVVFFSWNPVYSDENPSFISVEKISGKSFKNDNIVWDILKIYFLPDKEWMIKLRWISSNNIVINLGNVNWEKTFFSFFSASLLNWIMNKAKVWEVYLDKVLD